MESLLTVKEAAAFFNVSEMTVRRWTNSGVLKCYRVGGKRERRFRMQDLHEFLNPESTETITQDGMVQLGTGGVAVPDGSHLSHLCLDDVEGQNVGISFLQQGLSNNETVMLVASRANLEKLVNRLELRGIDIEKTVSRNLLHICHGLDTPTAMFAYIAKKIALAEGRFRLFGDMTWVREKGWRLETIRQLEEMGNNRHGIPGFLFFCQYPLASFSGEELMMVAETHKYTLYKSALRESPYFSPH
ncbi:MAG: MEDS domain-containing protein [Desulfobulbaceae bacterium]|nr:MEDS domain-containing protein [Desulfobulbaceae bacterium]